MRIKHFLKLSLICSFNLFGCDDACEDNLDVKKCGALLRPAMKPGSEIVENIELRMELKLRSGETDILNAFLGSLETEFMRSIKQSIRCIEWDDNTPSKYELQVLKHEDNNFFSRLMRNEFPMINEPIVIERQDFSDWVARKKGTRITDSEEEEELNQIAVDFNFTDEFWPDYRVNVGDKWEAEITSLRRLPRLSNMDIRSELQFVSTSTIGGHLCALIDEFTTIEGELDDSDDDNSDGKMTSMRLQFEAKIVFDLVDNIVLSESGNGLACLKIKRTESNYSQDIGLFNNLIIEGPFTYRYTALKSSNLEQQSNEGKEL
ncbi:MAG: hypothetical protein ACK5XN_38200 [Bacteroidota bacterium]|jgi:hypothetical protein